MSQKASQADSFLVTIAPFRAMERIRSAFKARVRQGLIVLAMLALGRIGECRPEIACDYGRRVRRAECQGRCVCGKANGFDSRFPKKLHIAAYPLLATFRFNRRLTGRGVQRTRTLYFGDLSIEICLDCDASFGFEIDMGFWDIGISLKALVSVCERG